MALRGLGTTDQGDLADDDARAITSKLNPSLAFYAVTIAIGLLVPVAAVVPVRSGCMTRVRYSRSCCSCSSSRSSWAIPGRSTRRGWLRVLTGVLIGLITIANAGSSIRLVVSIIYTEPFTQMFSPTDVSAIKPWAKLMMMAEEAISVVVGILVVARR